MPTPLISVEELRKLTNELRPGSFDSSIPGLQTLWDSTSLGWAKECARKYFYHMILMRSPRTISPHLSFGLWYHAALEKYDHERSAGRDHKYAMRSAVREALTLSGTYGQRWSCNYCEHFSDKEFRECPQCGSYDILVEHDTFIPWQSTDKNKTRENLVRTVIWYLEQFANDPVETVQLADGSPAVELSFQFAIEHYTPSGDNFGLAGHIDRLVLFQGDPYVLDRKSTKTTISARYFEQYQPDNQMSLYTIASKIVLDVPAVGVIIDAAQIAVTFSAFERGITKRTEGQNQEFLNDAIYYMDLAVQWAEQRYWPMNDKSCHHYGGCPFRDICAKPLDLRKQFLETSTMQHPWDPSVPRGNV